MRAFFVTVFLGAAVGGASACSRGPQTPPTTLRLLIEQPPVTLNPRQSLDASGQRLGELLFSALTRLDRELEPRPDLASRWQIENGGKRWRFDIAPGRVDQGGQPIDAAALAACLENYRVGKPVSTVGLSFTKWIGTHIEKGQLVLELSEPDPSLARNLTLIRYFRVPGAASPCTEPKPMDKSWIGSGPYRTEQWDPALLSEFDLLPAAGNAGAVPLRFVYSQDENVKVLKLLRGEVDAALNSLSLTKTRWFKEEHSDRFKILERDGVAVSYLAFNLQDPVLARLEVRRALALAIHRDEIVRERYFGFCQVAGSFLSPRLPESVQGKLDFDPVQAEKLLDQAGFPRKPDGSRLTLHYKSTPVREGLDMALIFQDMLKKVGIRLIIDVVEPSVFYASLRTGRFQLYSSRWIGVADASILARALHGGKNAVNRVHYASAEADRLLDQASADLDPAKRAALYAQVQALMWRDLPYFPLWYWNNDLIARKDLQGLENLQLSLSGSLQPLTLLRRPL